MPGTRATKQTAGPLQGICELISGLGRQCQRRLPFDAHGCALLEGSIKISASNADAPADAQRRDAALVY
jgi:hypothetical protein